ncbi:hypothetical protein [Bosea sp. (in: a-proteobacteria)]|jgi:hypothetical protein|uniref:hypothetical protein n=1 Tax=Bosea sp. (in: a-proteobacteria) TaxID=1871050 RepID=UPI003569EC7E
MTEGARDYSGFFRDGDDAIARAYVDRSFGAGAYLDFEPGAAGRDEILVASTASARDYMMQSASCATSGGQIFRVRPSLIETIRPNAFATRHRDLHLCGMNTGMYGAIFELCNFVMAQPGLFRDIGEPGRETATPLPPGVVPGFWLIDQLRIHGTIIDKSLAPSLMPKCPERYHFAVALTLHVMRFVWFHEMCHCLNGHVGALVDIVPSIRLNEMPDDSALATLVELEQASLPMNASAFLQAIELDADRSALWAAFRTQSEDKENVIALQQFDQAQRIKLSLLSAYLITFIMEEASRRLNSERRESHPDSYTRLHNLVRTTASHLLDARTGMQAIFYDVMRELKVLRGAIPSLVDVDQVLADCLSPQFQAVLDDKEEQVETARSYFITFSFN